MKDWKDLVTGSICVILGIFISYVFYFSDLGLFERWEQQPSGFEYDFSDDHPCDFSSIEFSFITNAPKNIVECDQITELHPEARLRYTNARDGDGNIWMWSKWYGGSGMVIKIICWPPIGLIVGIIIVIDRKQTLRMQKDQAEQES